MGLRLQTKRMRLRPIEQGDLSALLELDSDPAVMKYISGGKASTPEFYETALPRMMAYNGSDYGFVAAIASGLEDFANGVFLGWFHLRPSVVEPEILELGYRLRQCVWGRGLATEGSFALLQHAFSALGQERVDACAMPDNHASQAVMKKCGMKMVGEFMHPRGGMTCVRYVVDSQTFAALPHGA